MAQQQQRGPKKGDPDYDENFRLLGPDYPSYEQTIREVFGGEDGLPEQECQTFGDELRRAVKTSGRSKG